MSVADSPFPAADLPPYIERRADRKLDDAIDDKRYAALIGSRHSGKTWILLRQYHRLSAQPDVYVPVRLDFHKQKSLPVNTWFARLYREMVQRAPVRLPDPAGPVENAHDFQQVLLDTLDTSLNGRVLVFLIDNVEDIPDDCRSSFFHLIRQFYTASCQQPELSNLVFVLVGSFVPGQLADSEIISPFGEARKIRVHPISRVGVTRMVSWLKTHRRDVAPGVDERIYHWTEGDVYLTSKLCQVIHHTIPAGTIQPRDVDNLIQQRLYHDTIFMPMWHEISTDAHASALLDDLLDQDEPVGYPNLYESPAWLQGAVRLENNQARLRSPVHRDVLGAIRSGTLVHGRVVHERYELRQVIHFSLSSHIYYAVDLRTGDEVAIEQLMLSREQNEFEWFQFRRESDTLKRLNHPNIVRLVDSFEEDGSEYVVTEYVNGGSLADHLDEHGPLPVEQAIMITFYLADALHYAHEKGIIHHNIKASNILLKSNALPRLADFGLANLKASIRITTADVLRRMMPYQYPEIYAGEFADQRGDIWSLGVVLFEMLAGMPPFTGDDPAQIRRAIQHDPVPDIHILRQDLPDELVYVLMCMLERNRHRRFDAFEVRENLQKFLPL